jgi:hypothetical protein
MTHHPIPLEPPNVAYPLGVKVMRLVKVAIVTSVLAALAVFSPASDRPVRRRRPLIWLVGR